MSDRAFLIALDNLSHDNMEENPPLEEKAVGNPRRIILAATAKAGANRSLGATSCHL